MASTQKRIFPAGGRKTPPKPEPPASNTAARMVGGVVCALLALCILVSYFNVDALLLTFTAKVLRGALGYGIILPRRGTGGHRLYPAGVIRAGR